MLPRQIYSADQLPFSVLEPIFEKAEVIRQADKDNPSLISKVLKDKIFALLFWEASTRTFVSFFNAIVKLGGTPLPITNAGQFSSAFKGEILSDTDRTSIDTKLDGIIMRHSKAGSAQETTEVLKKHGPETFFINAGDGNREHPTQMGLDLYTIWRNKKEALKNGELVVAFYGELRDSRVFHSNAKALIQIGIKKLILVSEEGNDLPEEILTEAAKKRIPCLKISDPLEYAREADILMFTRLQLERKKVLGKVLKLFPFLKSRIRAKYNRRYGMTKELQAKIKPDALVMHPLPRVGDMPEWMDSDPRAVYLSYPGNPESQVTNGLYFRMALLTLMCT